MGGMAGSPVAKRWRNHGDCADRALPAGERMMTKRTGTSLAAKSLAARSLADPVISATLPIACRSALV
jgi:hypothetical protein